MNRVKRYIYTGLTALAVIAISISFYFAMKEFSVIQGVISKIIKILTPVIYGAVMTFLISPLYNKSVKRIEKYLLKKNFTKAKAYRYAKAISTIFCLMVIILIIVSLALMMIPQLIQSVRELIVTISNNMDNLNTFIDSFFKDNMELETIIYNYIDELGVNLTGILTNNILPNINTYLTGLSTGLFSALRQIVNFLIGIVVMMYLLNMKETLAAQAKRICYAIFPLVAANVLIDEIRYIKQVFSQFIVGKIIDSLIIGIINYIFMSIMGMQYSLIISVLIGVTNIIPFFGPFLGAIPAIFILLFASPISSLQFAIWILVLQQIDGNIIGPKILGQTTGLQSFWILFSILLFGGLFGLVGMIIAVPTFAIIYRLIARISAKLLREKDLSDESMDYLNLKYIDKDTHEYIRNKDNN